MVSHGMGDHQSARSARQMHHLTGSITSSTFARIAGSRHEPSTTVVVDVAVGSVKTFRIFVANSTHAARLLAMKRPKQESLEARWPMKGDRAFSSGRHRHALAYPTWMPVTSRNGMIAEGFRASADYVVRMLETEREHRYADMFFNPVTFLYRHFMEVAMKSIIQNGVALHIIPHEDVAKLGHNLHVLWNKCRKVIEAVNQGADPEPVLAVEQIVLEFHEIDQTGQELRYAVDTKGNECLTKAPEQVCLLNLRDVMEGVYNFFMGCDAQLDHLVECQADAYDYQ
jgi:hypothetical protein